MLHKKEEAVYPKKNQVFYTQHLFIQEYSTHPFIDVYVTKLNKGDAFDSVVSKLYEILNFTWQNNIPWVILKMITLPLENRIFQLE